jgi:hypothetical protein
MLFRNCITKASKNIKVLRLIGVLRRGYRPNQRPPHILTWILGVNKSGNVRATKQFC